MNSIIANKMEEAMSFKMEGAMSFLYEILMSNSEVQLSQNYTQITNQHNTIIVFERYISDSKAVFLYAYNSNSLIIIKQQHYKLDEFNRDVRVSEFLKDILKQNQNGACIYYINYASVKELDNDKIKIYAYKMLELPELPEFPGLPILLCPQSKIILMMEYQNTLEIPNTYLQIQIPQNNGALLALLKKSRNSFIKQEIYEEFTLKQITQTNEIHQMFMSQLVECENQVVKFNFLNLIKAITLIDPPEKIEYLAQFLMNLSRRTSLDTFIMITKLKLYKQNLNSQKAKNKKKLKINEQHLTQTELSIFQDKKYCHFPKKGENNQKCKVCQMDSIKIKKSSFICEACQDYYKINVTLCTIKCFKQFHLNPKKYLERKNRTIKVKVKEEE